MKRALILSSKNKKYIKEKKLLFAGEWALEEKKKLKKIDYVIFKSKSNLKSYRIFNSKQSNIIYQKICIELSKKLNQIHGINLSLESWKVIFGTWLRLFVDICYERHFLIKEILNKKNINKIYIYRYSNKIIAIDQTDEIYGLSNDNLWNNSLFNDLLIYFKYKNKLIIEFKKYKKNINSLNKNLSLLSKIKIIFFTFLRLFRMNNYAVISGTGIPFVFEKILDLLQFQVPQFYLNKRIKPKKINNNLRQLIKFKINDNKKNLENFIKSNLHNHLPKFLLENFFNIFSDCEKNYPKKPKFILTGGSNENDEYFKFYTAKKINDNKKFPYYVIQHGNSFINEDFIFNRPEYEVTKNFFTFGFNKEKFTKSFCNHLVFGKKINYNKNGFLQIVAPILSGKVNSYDRYQDFIDSLNLFRDFDKKISNEIKKKIILKLHSMYTTKRGMWLKNKFFYNFNLNNKSILKQNYLNNLKKSRLTIFFYDSTGILENLCIDAPTIGIWKRNTNHVRNDFVKKYNLLFEAKILFDNIDKMIAHINNIWTNPYIWWNSKKTQSLINKFNLNYNNKPKFSLILKLMKDIKKDL